MHLVLLGGPGSGKGTQGPRLAAAHSIAYLSTGELIRAEQRRGSELGARLAEYSETGRLAPDELIGRAMVEPLHVAEANGGWVLDGFPRTISQIALLEHATGRPALAVYLTAPDQVLRERLRARGHLGDRPDDQSVELIERRLAEFREQTVPVVESYRRSAALVMVDGDGAADAVTQRMLVAVHSTLAQRGWVAQP